MTSAYPPSSLMEPPPRRYALKMPAGSIRAILALAVLGLLALIVFTSLRTDKDVGTLYFYLWGLLFLAIANYFTVRSGMTVGPGEFHPLWLPRGSVRLILLVGLGGIIAWLWQNDKTIFTEASTVPLGLFIVIPAGFLAGWLVSHAVYLVVGEREPFWYQDVQAWVSIIAMGMLLIELSALIINHNLGDEFRKNLSTLDAALAAVISFYFGARS
jgi:glucan phosphoethanolaminetransferase (alkaline phosphatase superfamily)